MPSGFTLNVKAFHEKTSPVTLNGEGISEKAFTLDVKTYSLILQSSFILSQPSNSRKEGETWAGGGTGERQGIVCRPLMILGRQERKKADKY